METGKDSIYICCFQFIEKAMLQYKARQWVMVSQATKLRMIEYLTIKQWTLMQNEICEKDVGE